MVVRWVSSAYHSPMWIPILSGVAMASLVGTMLLSFLFLKDQSDERQNRIRSDVAFCERGNDLRRTITAIGIANEELVQGVVDAALPPDTQNGERAAAIARIRDAMRPAFQNHRQAVAEIQFLDCSTIPGAHGG